MIKKKFIFLVILPSCLSCSVVNEDNCQLRKMARGFQRRRMESLVAPFQYSRIVTSKGKCIHFHAVVGIADIEKEAHAVFYSSDALISALHDPKNGRELGQWTVNPQFKRSDLRSYYAGYNNTVRPQVWDWLLQIEKYTPLHPKRIRSFSYSIRDTLLTEGEPGQIIDFYSKADKANRIVGRGRIVVNSSLLPLQIELLDAIVFVNHRHGVMPALISPYRLSVYYGSYEGSLIVSRATLSVKWKLPDNQECPCWSIERNPVRNPFKYQIETETELLMGAPFSHPEVAAELKEHPALQSFICYTDTVDITKWQSRLGPRLNMLLQDLSCDEDDLTKQTLATCYLLKTGFEQATGEDYEYLYHKILHTMASLPE